MAVGARREDTAEDDGSTELVRIQSAFLPGYNFAIASSIRNGPIRAQAPIFAALGRQTRKQGGRVLLVWVRRTLLVIDIVSVYSLFANHRAGHGGHRRTV